MDDDIPELFSNQSGSAAEIERMLESPIVTSQPANGLAHQFRRRITQPSDEVSVKLGCKVIETLGDNFCGHRSLILSVEGCQRVTNHGIWRTQLDSSLIVPGCLRDFALGVKS